MVYYNPSALEDYSNILYGLLTWPKHPLEPDHAKQYMYDIEKVCRSLDRIMFHQKAKYGHISDMEIMSIFIAETEILHGISYTIKIYLTTFSSKE